MCRGVGIEQTPKVMAGYISLFDLGESQDDADIEYNSMHHYRVRYLSVFNVKNDQFIGRLWSQHTGYSETERSSG